MNKLHEGILRLSPGDQMLVFEASGEFIYFSVEICIEGGKAADWDYRKLNAGLFMVSGLKNGVDYSIQLKNPNGISSYIRLFRCGQFPGTVVNYIHPEDKTFLPSGMCPASPSILRMSSSRLLVSHDIFSFEMAQNQSKIFYSDDNGANWNYHSRIEGCFWGKLFIYQNRIYMLGNLHEYGDLVLYEFCSDDNSWDKACTVIKGGNKFTGGPHKSAMPVVEHNGRIWSAVEFGSWHLGGHACGVVSAEGDITKASNWSISEFLDYDPEWPGTPEGDSTGCIEGNIVVMPDGRLIDFLRFGIDKCTPCYGKALYLELDENNPAALPKFGKVVDFHGNHSKFCIYFSKITRKYWTIVNKADYEKPKRRNELILMSSDDIDNWKIEKTLLDYEHTGWYEDSEKAGFQYIDFIFSGDYIFYVSRTALNGAINYHDSNCITFHVTRYK